MGATSVYGLSGGLASVTQQELLTLRLYRRSARGLFDSVVLPTFPPASAQFLPPPSSCLPLLPCRCYHSSSSHINYIPLPLSKPGPELLLTSIPLELPCLWLATWLTGRLMSTSVMEGWGWIAWRLPHTTIRLGAPRQVWSTLSTPTPTAGSKE